METRKKIGLITASIMVGLVLYGISVRQQRENNQQVQEQEAPSIVDNCPSFEDAQATVNGATFDVGLAVAPAQQAKGLGGCDLLPSGAGLYFVYDKPKIARYWMKGMLIPIDLIWLRDGVVVGVQEAMQPVAEGEELEIYSSPEEIDAVLEISVGGVAEHDIKVGDQVALDPV